VISGVRETVLQAREKKKILLQERLEKERLESEGTQ